MSLAFYTADKSRLRSAQYSVDQALGIGQRPAPMSHGLLQRKADRCACGGSCPRCQEKPGFQKKLAISEPGDVYEREADRIADAVLAKSVHPTVHGAPQRIQRLGGHPTGQSGTTPPSVDQVRASPGRPLEPVLRRDMEQRFGYDFSSVRVHSGAAVERSVRDVNAHAYTVGQDIVFGAGQFAPGTYQGQRLIAHELTHVVQQSGADGISPDPSGDLAMPLWSAVHMPALQRQEARLEPTVESGSGFTGAEGSADEAQPAGFWDWILGKDHRVECAHELGKCNITCRCFTSQSQAYERCMTCCKTGYDICLDVGAFVTPEGGCARG